MADAIKNEMHASLRAVANATESQHTGEKRQIRTVDAAKKPRDYIDEFLADNPDKVYAVLDKSSDYGYREMAQDISVLYGMDFDHTTVYRRVKRLGG